VKRHLTSTDVSECRYFRTTSPQRYFLQNFTVYEHLLSLQILLLPQANAKSHCDKLY